METVTWDGSKGEGGGQTVRVASSLAAILGVNTRIDNIRANRPRGGGLRAQHVAGLQAISKLCRGTLTNCHLGSSTVELLVDNQLRNSATDSDEPLVVEIGTAGAITLVLQAAVPVSLRWRRNPSFVFKGGGTIADMAPLSFYFEEVLLHHLKYFGIEGHCQIETHGFYPKGGARASYQISLNKEQCICENNSVVLRAIDFTKRGAIVKVTGKAIVAGRVGPDVASRMAGYARKFLKKELRFQEGFKGDIDIEEVVLGANEAIGSIAALSLVVHMTSGLRLGFSTIGKRGAPAEKVAMNAKDQVLRDILSGAAVDSHMADQLPIFMVMAQGTSRILVGEPTMHLFTVVDIIRAFGVKVSLVQNQTSDSKTYLLEIEGRGLDLKMSVK